VKGGALEVLEQLRDRPVGEDALDLLEEGTELVDEVVELGREEDRLGLLGHHDVLHLRDAAHDVQVDVAVEEATQERLPDLDAGQ